jgi:hypothetical protein
VIRYARASTRSIVVLAMAAVVGACCGCRFYSADPIAAKVVDADTGLPLAGVNVVAEWTYGGGEWGDTRTHAVMVIEAVTDQDGRFAMPGWGPRAANGLLPAYAPVLTLFKSGYDILGAGSRGSSLETAPSHMRSDLNGTTLRLKRFEGSLEQYSERLVLLSVWFDLLFGNDECNWKAMPRMIWALEMQNEHFIANKVRAPLETLHQLSEARSGQCGSLEAYVMEHGT